MTRGKHIEILENTLRSGLGECVFQYSHPISYINGNDKTELLIVDLYEEKNKLVIFLDNAPIDAVQQQLIWNGFIPVDHIYNPLQNIDKDLLHVKPALPLIMGGFHPGANVNSNDIEEVPVYEKTEGYYTEVSDLIGKSPGWLLRSGITIFFFVIIVIITFSAFIKYPDKITSTGVITSKNPPIELYSKINARVDAILAPTGTNLYEGDPIIYLKNTANIDDVNQIKEILKDFDVTNTRQILSLQMPELISIGILQKNYSQLYLKIKEYQQVLRRKGPSNQIRNIQEEIENIGLLNTSLESEKYFYSKEQTLLEKDLQRHTELFAEGVISELEFEKSQKEFNQFKRQSELLNKNGIQSDIRAEALETEVLKIAEERKTRLYQYQFTLASLIEDMRLAILEWEDTYFIKAEVNGIVVLSDEISDKSLLDPQALIGYINPNTAVHKYARVLIPPHRRGEIKVGDKCLLKLDAYPYKEFGLIESSIGTLSALSTKKSRDMTNLYEVLIPVGNELITEYNKVLEYSPNMTITTEIITEEKTLLARVLNRFYDLIKNN